MKFFTLLKIRLLFACCLFAAVARGQTLPAELTWESFRRQVLDTHPLARKAELYRRQAASTRLRAAGAFDVKTYADTETKVFREKTYFQHTEAGLKWPSWMGLELKTAYLHNSGQFLNPENALPANGQALAGFGLALGQGFLIDDRRADLQQARIGLRAAEAERNAALNQLLLEAAYAYWNWVLAQNQVRLYEEALQLVETRMEGILESARQGDKPDIDTLETFIQVQNRRLDLNIARLELQQAALALSPFFWKNEQSTTDASQLPPAPALTEALVPPVPDTQGIVGAALAQHPELKLYEAKLEGLDVEKRLKWEKRKPSLNLQYNLLGSGWQFFPSGQGEGAAVFTDNMKWGLQFSYPLLNRKARGDYDITQVKIAQTQLDFKQKQQEVAAKVRQYAAQLLNLREQTTLYRDIAGNYRRMMDAENEKFRYGESSIFLINTREQRWLDARIKYLYLLASLRKTEAGLAFAAGLPIR